MIFAVCLSALVFVRCNRFEGWEREIRHLRSTLQQFIPARVHLVMVKA